MEIAPLTDAQQRVVLEIQRVAAELGVDRLSQRAFDRHHKLAGVTTAGYQFGSWNEAVKAAGLDAMPPGASSRGSKISDEELLRDLLRLEADGIVPTERKVARFGQFSPKPYKNRWGSVAVAIEAARTRFGQSAAR